MAELIVEDMTGLENANSYCSMAEYRTFAELNDHDPLEDKDLAVFLARATNFVDSLENSFVGKRLNSSQSLAFPRVIEGSCSKTPHLYPMSNLKKAVLYAVVAQSEGFSLLPTTISKDDYISKEKIEGALEVQYSSEYFSKNVLSKFPIIERYLTEYLSSNVTQLSIYR